MFARTFTTMIVVFAVTVFGGCAGSALQQSRYADIPNQPDTDHPYCYPTKGNTRFCFEDMDTCADVARANNAARSCQKLASVTGPTVTPEHGASVVQRAAGEGMAPRELCDDYWSRSSSSPNWVPTKGICDGIADKSAPTSVEIICRCERRRQLVAEGLIPPN